MRAWVVEEGGGSGREEGMLKERQEELAVMTVECVCGCKVRNGGL